MRIAIASGKGGTGKTMLATNLAALLSARGLAVQLLDADVEEPDCHLFLHPEIEHREPVRVLVPEVDEARCNGCGACGEVCAFNAIAVVGSTVLVFPELCHSCGACALLCPQNAIHEEERETGVVEHGMATPPRQPVFPLVSGVLAVGEAKAVPTTRATLAAADDDSVDVVLIDAPPGTSCPVIAAVRDSDLVVLVTEPTPFGLHDLELAVEMVRALGLRCVVVVNRAGLGDDRVYSYCADEGIEIVLELPYERRIAETYAQGHLLLDSVEGLGEKLSAAWTRIESAARAAEVAS